MRPPKKPPPDTVGNLRGRMRMLRTGARVSAGADARDGADYDRALAKHMKALESRLADLRVRLARVQEEEPPTKPTSEKPRGRPSGPMAVPPSKRAKKDGGDLLDELGAL